MRRTATALLEFVRAFQPGRRIARAVALPGEMMFTTNLKMRFLCREVQNEQKMRDAAAPASLREALRAEIER